MQVTGFGASASAWLSSIGKTTEAPTKLDVSLPAYDGKIERAEVAVPRMSFPTSAPVALGADGLLVLQEAGEAEPVAPSATEQFLELMKKSPEERLRDSILKSLGLTEDDLNSMAPEKRKMIEEMIAERMMAKST